MSLQNQPNMESQAEGMPLAHVSHSRRKFLVQAGAVSLPVVAAMKSGDAWGCVPLNCTGGDGSLSGTRSAVASAKKLADYSKISPIFESVDTIIKVVKVDLGYNTGSSIDGYLWTHYKTLASRVLKSGQYQYPLIVSTASRTSLTNLTSSTLNTWASSCNSLSASDKLYNTNGSKIKLTTSAPLITPLQYSGVLIHGNTTMNQFFPNIGSGRTVLQCLGSADPFEKYITAAFIGSIWQNCYIWRTSYATGSVAQHKFNCYPTTEELMATYKNVVTLNPKLKNITVQQALLDMALVFKAYTKTV